MADILEKLLKDGKFDNETALIIIKQLESSMEILNKDKEELEKEKDRLLDKCMEIFKIESDIKLEKELLNVLEESLTIKEKELNKREEELNRRERELREKGEYLRDKEDDLK